MKYFHPVQINMVDDKNILSKSRIPLMIRVKFDSCQTKCCIVNNFVGYIISIYFIINKGILICFKTLYHFLFTYKLVSSLVTFDMQDINMSLY